MKILHVANFALTQDAAVFYAMDRKISNGLIRNGHQVYDFSYRDMTRFSGWMKTTRTGRKEMVRQFLETVDHFQPDLLLLGHSELLTTQDLEDAMALCPAMKTAMWWVDPLDRIDHLKSRMGIIDVLFATTGVSALSKAVGVTGKTSLAFFPNITDASIETGRAFEEAEPLHDLVFIGRIARERQELQEMLKRLSGSMNVGIYGNDKANLLFGSAFTDMLSRCRMGISYSRYNDIPYYASDRIAQLTGHGVLTFSPEVPGMKDLFTSEEISYFTDWGDLNTKLTDYLSNPESMEAQARRGWEKSHEMFNERRVTQFMLEIIFGLPFSDAYQWQSQVCR